MGLVLVVALAAALAWEAIRRQQPLPLVERMLDQNVLLITIDTLRADTHVTSVPIGDAGA